MQSESINALAKALVSAKARFPVINKANTATVPTKSGGSYSYAYADIGDINAAVDPVLNANGLVVIQAPSIAPDGTPALTTTLLHFSGEYISEQMSLQTEGGGAQAQGSGITYARRYAKSAMLDLVIESDDDGRRAQEGGQRKPNAAVDVQTGEIDPRVDPILKAADEGSNTFLKDLAAKYRQYGKLSENQLASGFRAASEIISTPRSAPRETVPFFEPEEEF